MGKLALRAAQLFSALFCFVLLCSLCGCGGFQKTAPSEGALDSSAAAQVDLGDVDIGDELNFGIVSFETYFGYDFNENVTWRVLAIQDGKALIASKEVIEDRPFFENYFDYFEAVNEEELALESEEARNQWNAERSYELRCIASWSNSTLRQWLNSEFYEGLPSGLQQVVCESHLSNADNPTYGSLAGEDTDDRVFVLSYDEASQYFASDDARKAGLMLGEETEEAIAVASKKVDSDLMDGFTEDGNAAWWLRTPGDSEIGSTAFVAADGSLSTEGYFSYEPEKHEGWGIESTWFFVGVRPAMWITLPSGSEDEAEAAASESIQPEATPSPEVPAETYDEAAVAAEPTPPAGALEWSQASDFIGQTATFYGPVVGTNYAQTSNGQPTFLDVGADYPDLNRLSVVIWGEDRGNFAGAPESLYAGKTICVAGEVYFYNGGFYIKVADPSQIQVL